MAVAPLAGLDQRCPRRAVATSWPPTITSGGHSTSSRPGERGCAFELDARDRPVASRVLTTDQPALGVGEDQAAERIERLLRIPVVQPHENPPRRSGGDPRRHDPRPLNQSAVEVAHGDDQHTARAQLRSHRGERRHDVGFAQQMGDRVVATDHDVEVPLNLSEVSEVGHAEPQRSTEPLCLRAGTLDRGRADVAAAHLVPETCEPDCLRPDAASTVEDAQGGGRQTADRGDRGPPPDGRPRSPGSTVGDVVVGCEAVIKRRDVADRARVLPLTQSCRRLLQIGPTRATVASRNLVGPVRSDVRTIRGPAVRGASRPWRRLRSGGREPGPKKRIGPRRSAPSAIGVHWSTR